MVANLDLLPVVRSRSGFGTLNSDTSLSNILYSIIIARYGLGKKIVRNPVKYITHLYQHKNNKTIAEVVISSLRISNDGVLREI